MIDWQIRSLGDCVKLFSGGTPSKSQEDYWGGDIPWVSNKDMKSVRLREAEDHLTELGAQSDTRLVPPQTILIVVRGMALAKEFPVAMTTSQTAFNQDLKAIVPAIEQLDNEFLFYWLRGSADRILGIVDEAAHGTTRIQTDRLLSLPISLPPLSIQHRIASILSAYDDLIENNTQRIKALEAAAQALYREWFVEFRSSPAGSRSSGWRGYQRDGQRPFWERLPRSMRLVLRQILRPSISITLTLPLSR
ncbi:MAG: restriction endonuclease subunit S [Anaerolineae bacterium]|nr:restriction endonuclease subunit S [Anaerolineae bacterium]